MEYLENLVLVNLLFLNILSGLIEPNDGEILVDDIKINHNNLSSFQKKINYVPQNIFVLNDTIRKNICFWYRE